VVDKFSSSGAFICELDGGESPCSGVMSPAPLSEGSGSPEAVAVDPATGYVYVSDQGNNIIDVFSPSGEYIGRFGGEGELAIEEPRDVKVDSHGDVFVAAKTTRFSSEGHSFGVLEFKPSSEPATKATTWGESVFAAVNNATALATDPFGDVYVANNFGVANPVSEYSSADEVLSTFAEEVAVGFGLAANPTGDIYYTNLLGNNVFIYNTLSAPTTVTSAASEVNANRATLNGTVNPEGQAVVLCVFEYNAEGEKPYGHTAPCKQTQAEIGAGNTPVPVSAEVSGLTENTGYQFRLRAGYTHGSAHSQSQAFKTPGPVISDLSVSNVGVSSATINAQVNPLGVHTEYHFEYGTSTAYGASTPQTSIGAGTENVLASAHVEGPHMEGLEADTEYHYRVIATSDNGAEKSTAESPDETFHTPPPTTSALPDGRVYEMVTPPFNQNANVYRPNDAVGEPVEGLPTELPFQAALNGDTVAYAGDPTSGGNGSVGKGLGNEYLARRSVGGGWIQNDIQPQGYKTPVYQAFSPELATGVLSACDLPGPGLPALAEGAATQGGYQDLYATALPPTKGDYHPLFSTIPAGHTREDFGAFNVISYGEECTTGEVYAPAYAGASADLSHLLFEANGALTREATGGGHENNLYDSVDGQPHLVNVLPEGPNGEPGAPAPNATFGAPPTILRPMQIPDFSHVISADGSRIFWSSLNSEGQPEDLYVREDDARTVRISEGGRFWTASADASKVFYTNGALFEYDLNSAHSSNLTPGVNVLGVIGASEDGEYVYYVDAGNRLWLYHDGESTQIAALEGEDNFFDPPGFAIKAGDWLPGLGNRTAEVTPDGKAVVFMSKANITTINFPAGYDSSGLGEVYVYEAQGGELFCASCDPGGEPPGPTPTPGGNAAAFLPISHSNTYVPRWVSGDGGQVFFDSEVPLLPGDTNGVQDVYEWERDGVGSCRETRGCVFLLSGGKSASASWLLDASGNGNDVFIVTRAQLSAQDQNDNFDVYDARVRGVEPPSEQGCSGAGCQGVPPAPPNFATPASVTYNGVGNMTSGSSPEETRTVACHKGYVHLRGKCVRKPPKKHRKAQHRKARKARGAGGSELRG
jgi:DNA-binding beta-propeller fold protein YncE